MRLPFRDARIAPVSRDDVAAACAASVIDDAHAGAVHRITGPATHSAEEIARMAARASGSPMRHEPCSPAAYRDALRAMLDEPWPEAFASLCSSIAAGNYADPSTDFLRLVGRPAEHFAAFLARAAWTSRARTRRGRLFHRHLAWAECPPDHCAIRPKGD